MQDPTVSLDAAVGPHPPGDTTGSTRRSVKERVVHEVTRFGLMFVYLWVVFGLFVLFERIIRGQMGLGTGRRALR